MAAPRNIEPLQGAVPPDAIQLSNALEGSVGFTPEALVIRVNKDLRRVGLTGVEGNAFGLPFSLITKGADFLLTSPPRGEPWDSKDHFVPDIYAQVTSPHENLPDGQIIFWRTSEKLLPHDEINNGQIISTILDQLLSGIEAAQAGPAQSRIEQPRTKIVDPFHPPKDMDDPKS